MNLLSGVYEKCGGIYDYRWSWGYEKPDGLDEVNGKLMCVSCRN